jgi:chromosome segregation ATPase
MADNSHGDLVNLDEQAESQDTGAGASGDNIFTTSEMFNQQLEQMTQWKTQISSQMEAMRADGIKLLERQKVLAQERKRLADERAELAGQRKNVEQMHGEVEAHAQRLQQRAAELEQAQQKLLDLQHQREQAERELASKHKHLTDIEARQLAEDVRLREAMEQLEAQRRQLLEAQHQAAQEREKLDGEGRALLERIRVTGQELDSRTAAIHAAEQKLEEERQALGRQKQDLRTRLETFERDQAEQLDALAKQTKRLMERRQEVEAAEGNVNGALQERIAQATQALEAELQKARGGNDQRVAELEARLSQADRAAQEFKQRETQFQNDLAAAQKQLAAIKDELRGAGSTLEGLQRENSQLGDKLAEQIRLSREEAAQWQQRLDEVRAQSTGGNQALQSAQEQYEQLKKEFKKLKVRTLELQKAKDDLEFQFEVGKESQGKELESLRQELTQQLARRDEEISHWKQKYENAQAQASQSGAAPGPEQARQIESLGQQVTALQRERDELAAQLNNVQGALKGQLDEYLQIHTALEARVQELSQANAALESERANWQAGGQPRTDAEGRPVRASQRTRLLRQAKALRSFRMQMRESQGGLEQGRAELAQQREQLRARKENLEQVKRLLEKQEMVMARKLADHNAIKTVAAVGIFVIMVLGGAFLGVYKFVPRCPTRAPGYGFGILAQQTDGVHALHGNHLRGLESAPQR